MNTHQTGKILFLTLAVGLTLSDAFRGARPPGGEDPWASWGFLLGQWGGGASGEPGTGTGAFSFRPELDGKVLVRKGRTVLKATKDQPTTTHEDLMVVYRESGQTRAIYFDNEGHVIRYTASLSADGNNLTFLSEPAPSAPRFRLTYVKDQGGALRVKFEIAPPGKPEAFVTHVEGLVHRSATP